jgi:uncharacterized protein YegP (UPF0339 family)
VAINPKNDVVHVYEDKDGDFRWRRIDGDNHRALYGSFDGYEDKDYAVEAAETYNPDIPVLWIGKR